MDVAAGGNNNLEGNILTPVALGFTPSSVGLPAYLDAKAGAGSRAAHHVVLRLRHPRPIGPRLDPFRDLLDQSERFAHSRRALAARRNRRPRPPAQRRRPGSDVGLVQFHQRVHLPAGRLPDGRKHGPQLGGVPDGIAGNFQRSHERNLCVVEPVCGLVCARQLAAFLQALGELRAAHGIRVRAPGTVQPFYRGLRSRRRRSRSLRWRKPPMQNPRCPNCRHPHSPRSAGRSIREPARWAATFQAAS